MLTSVKRCSFGWASSGSKFLNEFINLFFSRRCEQLTTVLKNFTHLLDWESKKLWKIISNCIEMFKKKTWNWPKSLAVWQTFEVLLQFLLLRCTNFILVKWSEKKSFHKEINPYIYNTIHSFIMHKSNQSADLEQKRSKTDGTSLKNLW